MVAFGHSLLAMSDFETPWPPVTPRPLSRFFGSAARSAAAIACLATARTPVFPMSGTRLARQTVSGGLDRNVVGWMVADREGIQDET